MRSSIISQTGMALLILCGPVFGSRQTPPELIQGTPEYITDHWLFERTLDEWVAMNAKEGPERDQLVGAKLKWSPEQFVCTSEVVDDKQPYNFRTACLRNYFGIQNYRAQWRYTRKGRKRLNKLYQKDRLDQCPDKSKLSWCKIDTKWEGFHEDYSARINRWDVDPPRIGIDTT